MNVKLSKLKPNPSNPRTVRDEKFIKLKNSIEAFPDMLQKRPIVAVTDKDGKFMVLGGNMRLKACADLGMKEVPVILADEWTEEQRREFIIKDNVGFGEWDWDNLANEWDAEQLAEWGLDLPVDFGAETNEGLTDPDEVPEVPETPITVLGDVWILGRHRIVCGDSTEADTVGRLMNGTKADMMFTDPPYGVNYEGGHFHSGDVTIKRKREKLAEDDSTAIYNDFLPVALSVVDGPCYMWFADSKARDVYNAVHDNQGEVHALIIWHKTNATYAAMNAQYKQRHEPCLYFKPKGSTLRWCGASTEATVWSEDRDAINEFHPTQKPVALALKAIANHDAKTVVDMFCGSGSTIIAADKLGRQCFAIELSPAYVDVAVKRWQDFTGQQAIHEASGKTFAELAEAQVTED